MTLEMIQAEKPDEVVISTTYGSKVVMIELENEILKGMDHHNKKIEGTAKFIESGSDFDMMKEKLQWLTMVLGISVVYVKQMI